MQNPDDMPNVQKKRIACKNGEKVHQILGVNMQDPSLIFLFATFER